MSYAQLQAITQEAKQMRREDDERELVDCPVCGAVLDVSRDGVKNCPMGHYRAPAGARQAQGGG